MRRRTQDMGTALMLEFDPRLADVWMAVIGSGFDLDHAGEEFSWFLRMAYLQGYQDALVEESRGTLFRKLGLPVPKRSRKNTQTPGVDRGGR